MHPPIELAMFIELSIMLAEMVYVEHQKNTMIGYLSPDHINVDWEGKTAHLCWHTENHEAYHSPEHFGRFNLVPNGQSDLYTLGVILYELLTGQLPFNADHEEDWSIVHIRSLPQLLSDIRPGLGETLQAILMKLLAKSPADRYQSAYGVLEDLKLYQNMMDNNGTFTPVEVGRLDQFRTLSLSNSWVGRNAEVMQMENGLELALNGMNAFRWVVGREGTGKSALVHRLEQNVVRYGGRMIIVQTEPSQQHVHCGPILQAIREWIHQLWSEPVDTVTLLKAKLQVRFGQEMQIILSYLPELKLLFNNDPEVSYIPDDSKVWERFEQLLPDLICCIAECKPPLVLFIDNLQWVDRGTQDVIHQLTLTQQSHGLFLVGAFRTEEVIISSVDELNLDQKDFLPWLTERCRLNPEEHVVLPPLTYEDVRQLISDALHEKSTRIQLLAQSVYHQTGGNPRSVHLLLEAWVKENRLYFDERRRQWRWDLEIIQQHIRSEKHLRLLEMGFSNLSEERKEFLAMAAAIGQVFQLSLLAEVCSLSVDQAFRWLQEAEAEGFIYQVEEVKHQEGQDSVYVFVHEFIHQMIYAFNSKSQIHRHRAIGRLLQDRSMGELRGDLSRPAIDHLNLAASLLSEQETRQLIEYNLYAGRAELASGNYEKGKHYAENGLHLLTTYKMNGPSTLDVDLKLVFVWTEYMSGNTERAKELLVDMNRDSGRLSRSDRFKIWAPLIQFHAFTENETAVQFGMEALGSYGWRLEGKSSLLSIVKEVTQTRVFLHRKRENLLLLSSSLDEEYEELCHIMELLFFPLLTHDPRSLLELYARFIRYGLQKGVNESLATMIGGYELLVQRSFPSFAQATPIAERLFLEISSTSTFRKKHVFTFLSGMFKQMDSPMESPIVLFNAMRQGMEAGDSDFSNMTLIFCVLGNYGNMRLLDELLLYFEENMRRIADNKILEMIRLMNMYIAVLQDDSLTDRFVAIRQVHTGSELEETNEDNYSCGWRLEVAYLSGRYREALYWAKRGRANELSLDWMQIRKHRVYESLALAGLYVGTDLEERKQIRKALLAQLRSMKGWRGFLDRTSSAYSLIKAEAERISGNQLGAMNQYTEAIKRAKTEKYVLMEAIACERLAVYYQDDLLSRSGAAIMMMDACAAYSEWGITSKVTQIRSKHAELLDPVYKRYEGPVLEERVHMTPTTELPQQNSFKMGEFSKSEEEFELVEQLMYELDHTNRMDWKENLLKTALRQSRAERGLLLKCQNNEFFIEANASDWTDTEKEDGLYAESVLRHTTMTTKPLVLYDAIQSFWVRDAYIAARKQRSILCMPIAIPGEQTSYLLYLENRQMPGVFTVRNAQMLEIIATRIIYLMLLEDEASDTTIPNTFESNHLSEVSSLSQAELTEPLTERETEIITAIAKGLSNKEIANLFGIAETTVKTHTSRIYDKLGVKRRGQAVVRARELQWIE